MANVRTNDIFVLRLHALELKACAWQTYRRTGKTRNTAYK